MIEIPPETVQAFTNSVANFSTSVLPFMVLYIGLGVAFYIVRNTKLTFKKGIKLG